MSAEVRVVECTKDEPYPKAWARFRSERGDDAFCFVRHVDEVYREPSELALNSDVYYCPNCKLTYHKMRVSQRDFDYLVNELTKDEQPST